MKINSTGNIQGPASTRRKSSTGKSGETFSTPSSSTVPTGTQASSLSGASAVQSVDALLALQGMGDFSEARQKATERAFSMLDVLDDLKIALLEGGIPRQKLTDLMDILRSRRDQTHDPRLEAALDEVEVRAAVELAKYNA